MKIVIEGGAEIEKLLEKIGDEVERESVFRQAVSEGAQALVDYINPLAPGPHIGFEIESANAGGAEAAIGPDKEHWYYIFAETGAQPHEVGPDMRQALMFEGGEGKTFLRKATKHPGVGARPFLRPAVDRRHKAASDAVGKVIAKVIERIANSVGR
jgi:hypothetical protein